MIKKITVHHSFKNYFGNLGDAESICWSPYIETAETAVKKFFRNFRNRKRNGCGMSETMHLLFTGKDPITGNYGYDYVLTSYDGEVMAFMWFGPNLSSKTEEAPITEADVMRIVRAGYDA